MPAYTSVEFVSTAPHKLRPHHAEAASSEKHQDLSSRDLRGDTDSVVDIGLVYQRCIIEILLVETLNKNLLFGKSLRRKCGEQMGRIPAGLWLVPDETLIRAGTLSVGSKSDNEADICPGF